MVVWRGVVSVSEEDIDLCLNGGEENNNAHLFWTNDPLRIHNLSPRPRRQGSPVWRSG